MKQKSRRKVLAFLSMLPIGSIAFAARFANVGGEGFGPDHRSYNFEGELLRRLEEGSVGEKYYDFMARHEVPSVQSLKSKSFVRHLDRLTKEFVSDVVNPLPANKLVNGALSSIPPD